MELWKTDGTAEGTVMVSDILPGTVGSFPNYLTAVNNLVFFIGFDDVNGYEIWRSDGTEAGTFLTKDLSPGLNYQNPIYLTKSGTNYGLYSTVLIPLLTAFMHPTALPKEQHRFSLRSVAVRCWALERKYSL